MLPVGLVGVRETDATTASFIRWLRASLSGCLVPILAKGEPIKKHLSTCVRDDRPLGGGRRVQWGSNDRRRRGCNAPERGVDHADRGGEFDGVDPQTWLADVLARIADHTIHRLDELLPWNWAAEMERRKLAA
jgi:hypothetical protein